jgi:putative restriction endonuclease
MSSSARGAKYAPLIEYLKRQSGARLSLTFAEVEIILDAPLPASARIYPAWWANETDGTHNWAHEWMKAGWLTEEVSFTRERVTFVRKP